MENNLLNVLEVFEGAIIRIPAFQRGYSWEERQLDELWKDILNLEPNYETNYHFTGVLVFEELSELPKNWIKEIPQEKVAEGNLRLLSLVDGQQRLTSIIILMYVIIQKISPYELTKYLSGKEKEELYQQFLRIKHNESNLYLFGYEIDTPSHQYLLNQIFEDDSVSLEEPHTVYTHNLEFAKSFFKEKIEELTSTGTLSRILHILMYQLKFSRLLLNSTEIDISMVFETLNFRGKPLSHLELLKNRLLYLLARDKERIKNDKILKALVIKTWLTIYEYLGKTDGKWINEDEFLRSYWLIFFDHNERKKGYFNDYVEDIFDNRFPITSDSNEYLEFITLKKFLTNLRLAIKAMFFIYNPDQIHVKSGDASCEFTQLNDPEIINLLKKLNELKNGWQAAKNIICAYIISDEYSTDNLKEILVLLERHNFLVYNLHGKKSDTNRVYFFRMVNNIFEFDDHGYVKKYILKLIEHETNNPHY